MNAARDQARQLHDEQQLDDLIERADDALLKAMLLVMRKMSSNLDAQINALKDLTAAVQRIDGDFQDHEKEDSERVAMARGALWGASLLIGALFGLVAYVLATHIAADAKDAEQIRLNTIRLFVLEQQVGDIQRRQRLSDR